MIKKNSTFVSQRALILLASLTTGCESLGPSLRDRLPLEPVAMVKDEQKREHDTQFTDLTLDEAGKSKKKPAVEMYPGSGETIRKDPHAGRSSQAGKAGNTYSLNFDGIDIGEFVKTILGETLKQNYVLSPDVSGQVTIQTARPLYLNELIPTLEMVLRMNGMVMIKDGTGYVIQPAVKSLSGVKSPHLAQIGENIPNGFQIRVIPLRYIGVEEMQKILEPLLPEKSIVRSDKVRNLLTIAGTSAELVNVLETIDVFDVNLLKGMSVLMYPLTNVDAETVVGELNEIFGKEEDSPLNGMFKLIPIERMNTVMVITPQPEYLREARTWLDRLDRSIEETGAGSGGVYVYRVQNVEAVDLADILNNIFTEGKSKSTPRAQVAPGSTATEIGGDSEGGDSNRRQNSQSRAPSSSQFSVGNNQEVRVIADEKNNSLVVVATAQAYEILKKVIIQLDIPPLEVLIDATVVEINLTDNLQYGVQWFIEHSLGPYGVSATLSSNSDSAVASGTLTQPAGGFFYSLTNSAGAVRAIITALAADNKMNVVSSPSLMVLNNQEAFINVGDQVPIATSQQTNTNSVNVQTTNNTTTPSAIVSNQIQLIDTGVTLKIKPRVNAGGMVIMEVTQEVKNAKETKTSTINSPTIAQRKIESTIAVQSGDTIVLGGLIRDSRNRIVSGIPLLKDIPYIGSLFSNTTKSLDRTELVVLITPRVVHHRNDAVLITDEFKRKLTGLYEDVRKKPEDSDNPAATGPRGMINENEIMEPGEEHNDL